jgi:hypothetical protein
LSSLGDGTQLKGLIQNVDWNEYHIIARSNLITQIPNGRVMSILVDDDVQNRK